VIDYGLGNLFSVQRALETVGADVEFISTPSELAQADRVILPGVGAFSDGMRGLDERGLIDPIREYAQTGRPLLGICLGMQMLATTSDEFGQHEGLGLIPGRVVAVPPLAADGAAHKIPHVGWVALHATPGASWEETPLEPISDGTCVYLVHSYHVLPDDEAHLLAECSYGGQTITAAIRSNNVTGFQFHPEKSGPTGLTILRRFVDP